ncbi:hypothetical protein [Cytobacillus oceanisediminis]|uniref:hypothetical protein n=1 Tax=Cytobacillus oceanisediminis TaxID=665099 RepID=UPI00207937F9|nr:hypothetical protein [Cytobacillus oceanisediminis]USK44104.1 hypothetical protein LIT27_26655 [Cytobacillus oceanisediminis]
MPLFQNYIASDNRYLCSVINTNDINNEDIVILVHGLTETKAEKEFLYSKISHGVSGFFPFTVVQFDLSGHGDSEGEIKQFNLYDWINDTINVAKSFDNYNQKKFHLIGTGIGNIIISYAAKQLKSSGINVYSQIFISPKNSFNNIKSYFENSNSFEDLKEIIDVEEFLRMTYANEQLSDSMLLFEPSPTFLNENLHKCLIQLGSFSYDNVVTEFSKKLIEDISKFSLLDNVDHEIKTLVIQGTENSWFEFKPEGNSNILVEKISGDNFLLFNNPRRQNEIVDKIINFFNVNRSLYEYKL